MKELGDRLYLRVSVQTPEPWRVFCCEEFQALPAVDVFPTPGAPCSNTISPRPNGHVRLHPG